MKSLILLLASAIVWSQVTGTDLSNPPLNFLFLPMSEEMSHKRSFWPIAQLLGNKGHNVVFWTTPYQDNKSDPIGFVSEDIILPVKLVQSLPPNGDDEMENMIWHLRGFPPRMLILAWMMMVQNCKAAMDTRRLDIEEIARRKWDLVVIDISFSPCGFLIAKLANAPVAYWSTSTQFPYLPWTSGLPNNPAVAPQLSMLPDSMPLRSSFFNRMRNTWNQFQFLPVHKYVAYQIRQMAPQELSTFSFEDALSNTVMNFAQFPKELLWPAPWMPGIVHLEDTCRLPSCRLQKELESFISDPDSKGTILIALGHMGKWSAAPETTYQSLRKALLRLTNYRIIWQCDVPVEDQSLESHIKRLKWIPQIDLLGHSKTRLFYTHGGLKSFMEGICCGVPMAVMPLFAEQYHNAAIIQEKQLDKPIRSADYAVHAVERAARHGKRLHMLQLKASQLSFPTYFCLDSLAFLISVVFVAMLCTYHLLWYFWNLLVRQK